MFKMNMFIHKNVMMIMMKIFLEKYGEARLEMHLHKMINLMTQFVMTINNLQRWMIIQKKTIWMIYKIMIKIYGNINITNMETNFIDTEYDEGEDEDEDACSTTLAGWCSKNNTKYL